MLRLMPGAIVVFTGASVVVGVGNSVGTAVGADVIGVGTGVGVGVGVGKGVGTGVGAKLPLEVSLPRLPLPSNLRLSRDG